MITNFLSQVQQSVTLQPQEREQKTAAGTGNTLPPEGSGERVTISAGGRSALEREVQNIAEARDNHELVDLRGHDGQIRLGLMAIGQSAIQDWSSRGLELNEESILAAGEAFQNAFRENVKGNGSSMAGSAVALNRHQIIINSQAVPDWFVEEYEHTLSAMGDKALKTAFENGQLSFVR